jgi:hypothetical protein
VTKVIRNLVALATVSVVACVGCGPKTDKLPISGKVTLDGVPLDSGAIRFVSQGGAKLQATGAMIQAGDFSIPAEKGLLTGVYHVTISSPDAKAKPTMVSEYPGGPAIPVAPDRIPPEYNTESQKTIEVTSDGDNEFNFDVISAAK